MKRIIFFLLAALLLLTACGTSKMDDNIDTVGTVENIFTADETTSDETAASETSQEEITIAVTNVGFYGDYYQDSAGRYTYYEGGELSLSIKLSNTIFDESYSGKAIAVILFLDGQPQPYRAEGGDSDSDKSTAYIHSFYPEDEDDGIGIYDIALTPVTGSDGDTLELYAAFIWNPTYFAGSVGEDYCYQTGTGMFSYTRLVFTADPPETEKIDAYDGTISSCSTEYVDLTDDEVAGWSDDELLTGMEYHFYVNDDEMQKRVYGVTSNDTVKVKLEVFGTQNVTYGFTIFVNHEPILIDGSAIEIAMKTGQKYVVEVELDMSDFDGKMIIYAALAPHNFRSSHASEMASNLCDFQISETRYLSKEATWEELLASYGIESDE